MNIVNQNIINIDETIKDDTGIQDSLTLTAILRPVAILVSRLS